MIQIENDPWAAMVAHARASYPNECCGAMLGSTDGETKTVREAIALQNAFEGAQAARYELRPEDLLAADKAARERNMDLIGIYHSHPFNRAYPSATDLAQAWEGLVYVIVSLRDFLRPTVKAFTVADGEIGEQPIEIVDAASA